MKQSRVTAGSFAAVLGPLAGLAAWLVGAKRKEQIMKRKFTHPNLLMAILFLWTAPLTGQQPPQKPVITTAVADLEAEPKTLSLVGANFGPSPKVFMGDGLGTLEELVVLSSTDTVIQALLAKTDPGTYLVVVSTGPAPMLMLMTVMMDVTIGAVGPAGPSGLGDAHSLDAEDGDPADVVFVNNDGNVGIGTTSPGAKLQINTGSLDTKGLVIRQPNAPGNELQTQIEFQSGSGIPGSHITTRVGGQNLGIFTESNMLLRASNVLRLQSEGASIHFLPTSGAPSGGNGLAFRFFFQTLPDLAADDSTTTIHYGVDHGTPLIFSGRARNTSQFIFNRKIVALSGSANLVRFTEGGVDRMVIDGNGNVGIGTTSPNFPLEMGSGAHVTVGGVWTNASSRELKENIRNLTVEEALATLRALKPTRFNYKIEKEEEYVGFIAEEVPELVATKDRKALSAMDIVAVLTKVVQEQQKQIEELKSRMNAR